MTPTNPQDIAAALAFLADQGVDTGWSKENYAKLTDPPQYYQVWTRLVGNRVVQHKDATPYDIHAITDMLTAWLATRHEPCESRFVDMGYAEDGETPCWCSWSMAFGTTDMSFERKHPEATNRLAAHLAACREVEEAK